ncbi:MAG TPA: OmpH family outer membrane protein [Bdellovibrionota bacterium]|jgi:outer membrane protein
MKKSLVFASLLIPGFALAAAQSGKPEGTSTRVALIRMQDAIKDTKDGKSAEKALKKEIEDRQKKLESEGQKIRTAMEELRKQGMVMDEKSRGEKEAAIQKQVMAFEESKMRSQQEFQKRDQEISEPIIKKLRSIVATVSKEKGYNLVIDTGSVVYAETQDDITDEVIKRYDSKK